MYLNSKIKKEDLKEILVKYNFFYEHKNAYFNRKNNIGNLIYDHFFQILFNRLFKIHFDNSSGEERKNHNSGVKSFIKSIESCNSDYSYIIDDNKVNFSFNRRKYIITNFYNTLLFEIYVNKIFKEMVTTIYKKGHESYLLEGKYFGYFKTFDYTISKNFDINIIGYKHYFEGWDKFESTRDKLLLENKFFIETDIEAYYDNIPHDLLIHNLSEFFRIYGDTNSDEFIYKFSGILFKVSGYTKKGIPQGVMASDTISTIHLWLHFFLNKDKTDFKLSKGGYYSLVNGIKFINYNDDYYFFGNSSKEKLNSQFNGVIRVDLESEGVKLSMEKTKDASESNLFNYISQVNLSLVQKKEKNEIKVLYKFIIDELKKDTQEINLKALRKYFKWTQNIKYLDEQDSKYFFNEIWLIFSGTRDFFKVKKIFILLIISTEDFLFLIKGLISLKGDKVIDKFLKRNLFENNMHLLSDSRILKLYLGIRSEGDEILVELSSYFFDYLTQKNSKFILSYLKNSSKPLDIIIQDNGLKGLHDVLYGGKGFFHYSEDILGIKLYSLFGIITDNQRLVDFLQKEKNDDIRNLTFLINDILDDMIITKNIFPNYFLKNPSFLSDLYSLFNITLTFYLHIMNPNVKEVKIGGGSEAGYINVSHFTGKSENKSLRIYDKDFDIEIMHLMYYVAKKRAMYNHKEVPKIDKDISSYIYKKYEDIVTFHTGISKAILYILNLISKQLYKDN